MFFFKRLPRKIKFLYWKKYMIPPLLSLKRLGFDESEGYKVSLIKEESLQRQ
jgi:hypothetical protein